MSDDPTHCQPHSVREPCAACTEEAERERRAMSEDVKLLERIDRAIQRITDGHGAMRVPADMTDPDIVLDACRRYIDAEPARLVAAREEQREAAAQWAMRADVTWDTLSECGDAIRATPLTATPLEDEIKALRKERDNLEADLRGVREGHLVVVTSAEFASIAALKARVAELENHAHECINDNAELVARAEKAEWQVAVLAAQDSVHGGEWCAENRAAGRDRCGACSWCVKFERDRAEKAEAESASRLAQIEDAIRQTKFVMAERDEAVKVLFDMVRFYGGADADVTRAARAVLAKYPEVK